MKTLKNLSILLMTIAVLCACDDPQDEVSNDIEMEESWRFGKHHKHKKQILPLYAKFVTSLTPTDETGNCEAPYVFFNNQEGEGKLAIFGNFTTRITFCVNPQTLEYVEAEGTFFMENGDELYFTGSGQVLPSDHPNYDLEFHDIIVFKGGTGRFEGAYGWGRTDSFVKLLPEGGDQTDHKWKGKLILPGKHKHKKRWSWSD